MTGSLGRRYARALLGLARTSGSLAPIGEELARVAAIFAESDLSRVVLNPGIARRTRRAVVGKVVERLEVSPMVGNLVHLLADRDRLNVLSDVARAYDALVDRELGRARVTVRSAASLTPTELTEVEGLARKLTGSQLVIMSTVVDPDLIGGVALDVGGTVYDGSVKTQLARLAGRMAGAGA